MQDKLSSFSSYLTSGLLALTGAFSIQDWAAVIGVVMVFVTYFTNRSIKLKLLDEVRKQRMSEELYEKINQ
ncbi:phage holin family protein [Vibrio cortegadensis]|uniref:phage holin family protein n=1 Tax=Vibrio cortegadensis TaxID=1328770 RepID=UPI0021C3669B|nr:phage holin family protein [Vibrio cortegadensis]MDN3699181.1 phage holin family protein [Vibrio cortegadensis]